MRDRFVFSLLYIYNSKIASHSQSKRNLINFNIIFIKDMHIKL